MMSPYGPRLRADTSHDIDSLGTAIEDYALLGDTRSAALVGPDGSIDWLCVPRFDGRPLFGRLVGGPAAGSFSLAPARPLGLASRRYRPESVTLETTWDTDAGPLTLTEGMVAEVSGDLLPSTMLVRRLTAQDGRVEATITFDPRLGEQHQSPRVQYRDHDRVLVCTWPTTAVALRTTPAVHVQPGLPHTVTVSPDRPFTCVLAVADREPLTYVDPDAAWEALLLDELRWEAWGPAKRPPHPPPPGGGCSQL
jgi:hypothetical protein